MSQQAAVATDALQFHVVFNNVPYKAGLETGWGFACLIEGLDTTVLFDTGASGEVLVSNMEHLGLDPKSVQAVVLSHPHQDHTGGLSAVLARQPGVTVYLPESFPADFKHSVQAAGAAVDVIAGPRRLFDGVHSTGVMGSVVKEQALIVDTSAGLVLVTGCAHPNVAEMAERAKKVHGKDIYLLMGGFHLLSSSRAEIRSVIARLRELGVLKVAPSHCTGDEAIEMFRDAWGEEFVDGGLGAVIDVPR